MLTNVLGNAIKFTARGEVSLRVSMSKLIRLQKFPCSSKSRTPASAFRRKRKRRSLNHSCRQTARPHASMEVPVWVLRFPNGWWKRWRYNSAWKARRERAPLSDLWCDSQEQSSPGPKVGADHPLAHSRILIVDHHENSNQFLHDQLLSWTMRKPESAERTRSTPTASLRRAGA